MWMFEQNFVCFVWFLTRLMVITVNGMTLFSYRMWKLCDHNCTHFKLILRSFSERGDKKAFNNLIVWSRDFEWFISFTTRDVGKIENHKRKTSDWWFSDTINNSKLAFDQSEYAHHDIERDTSMNTIIYSFAGRIEWGNTIPVWLPSILAFHNLHVDSRWDEVPAHSVQISAPTLPRDKLRGLRHLLCVYADHHKESLGKYKLKCWGVFFSLKGAVS